MSVASEWGGEVKISSGITRLLDQIEAKFQWPPSTLMTTIPIFIGIAVIEIGGWPLEFCFCGEPARYNWKWKIKDGGL